MPININETTVEIYFEEFHSFSFHCIYVVGVVGVGHHLMRYSSTWTGSRNLCSRTADWLRRIQHYSSRSTARRRLWPRAMPATRGWAKRSRGEYLEQCKQPWSGQKRLSFTMFQSKEIEGKDLGFKLVVLSWRRHKFQMRGLGNNSRSEL